MEFRASISSFRELLLLIAQEDGGRVNCRGVDAVGGRAGSWCTGSSSKFQSLQSYQVGHKRIEKAGQISHAILFSSHGLNIYGLSLQISFAKSLTSSSFSHIRCSVMSFPPARLELENPH